MNHTTNKNNNIEIFLEQACDKYKKEVKELAKLNKYATIILSINMFNGELDKKYNIKANLEINRSEII